MSARWTLCSFEEDLPAARSLARALDAPLTTIERHRFPDGESRVRIDPIPERAIVPCSLRPPNEKLLELLLAASVLACEACARPVLVAPYLPYMRQDAAFRTGEAVSQRVVGQLLASAFRAVLSVDPHLHRTARLADVFPGALCPPVSAAALLAEPIRALGGNPLLVGPDRESGPLVEAVARRARADFLVLDKTRSGDRCVRVSPSDRHDVRGRHVVIVDDLVSTGATLVEVAKHLHLLGCTDVEALVVHALYDEHAAVSLAAAGIRRIRSCDTVPHPTNAFAVAPLLAEAIRTLDSDRDGSDGIPG